MLALVKRNIKIYFRNKGAWLASLLTVFIIIGLYALFLGDQLSKGFEDIEDLTVQDFLQTVG